MIISTFGRARRTFSSMVAFGIFRSFSAKAALSCRQPRAGRARSSETPWRCRDPLGATLLMTRSPIEMVPDVISSRPVIMRKVVDFPQPDGPTKTTNSRSAMSKLVWSTTLGDRPFVHLHYVLEDHTCHELAFLTRCVIRASLLERARRVKLFSKGHLTRGRFFCSTEN